MIVKNIDGKYRIYKSNGWLVIENGPLYIVLDKADRKNLEKLLKRFRA